METRTQMTTQTGSSWRFKLGITIFAVGFLSPLLIPVVKATALPTAWKVFISGALAVGIPELFAIAAVAVMGKDGFNILKSFIFQRLQRYAPPDEVSPNRYRIGLIMFVLPLLFGWLAPYVPTMVPGYNLQCLLVNLIGDVIFISSLFVLGGNFWDKVRALFIHGATVR